MKLEPIIISLLDTDLYKFNMDQVIFHKHTDLCGQYYFKCRNEDIVFTPEMVKEIEEQVDHLCSLRFTKSELDYLRSIRFIKNDYVEFLRLWHPIRDYVSVSLSDSGELSVVVDGPLFSAMQFEIYLLEIINEVYFRFKFDYAELLKGAEARLDAKIKAMNDGTYIRRRKEEELSKPGVSPLQLIKDHPGQYPFLEKLYGKGKGLEGLTKKVKPVRRRNNMSKVLAVISKIESIGQRCVELEKYGLQPLTVNYEDQSVDILSIEAFLDNKGKVSVRMPEVNARTHSLIEGAESEFQDIRIDDLDELVLLKIISLLTTIAESKKK